jgi:hypothetical protein
MGVAVDHLGGGVKVVCMRDKSIFNEMWAQDKINILVGILLFLNMKLPFFYNLNFTKVYFVLQKYVIH